MNQEKKTSKLTAALVCILIGLVIGFLVLLVIEPKGAFAAMVTMLQNFLYYPNPEIAWYYLGMTLVRATPLALCALSVIYAKNAGLFNIGASGQFTAGAMISLLLALKYQMPWWVCLPAAAAAGGVAGALTGYLRASRGANEVIIGILINWILLYLANNVLEPLTNSAKYSLEIMANAPEAHLPGLGLDVLFSNNQYMTIAVPLTILIAFFVRYVVNHTILGYETRATGFNIHAARLAGMRTKGNIVLTMFIAGALCGLAASFSYLSGFEQWATTASNVPAIGFDAIAAAYLGCLNPIGALLSSFFIQHIAMGSCNMDKLIYPAEIASLVTAIIIYASAFSALIVSYFGKKYKEQKEKTIGKEEKQ